MATDEEIRLIRSLVSQVPGSIDDMQARLIAGLADIGFDAQARSDMASAVADAATAATNAATAATNASTANTNILTSSVWTPFGLHGPYQGSAGNATISGATTIANQVQQYGTLTINAGQVLTAGFSPQIVICQTLAFGNTSSQISANGLGPAGGGVAVGVTGYGGKGAFSSTSSGFALPIWKDGGSSIGGAGVAADITRWMLPLLTLQVFGTGGGGGGGGGGHGTSFTTGVQVGTNGGAGQGGGSTSYNDGGSGGSGTAGGGGGGRGSGVAGQNGTGGAGGAGGGVLIVITDSITTAAGLITANGADGSSGSGSHGGGGGGGAGGLVLLFTRSASVTPTLQANGGAGGGKTGNALAGGAGGAGVTFAMGV